MNHQSVLPGRESGIRRPFRLLTAAVLLGAFLSTLPSMLAAAVAQDDGDAGWLGVGIRDVTPAFAETKKLTVKEGAYVESVSDESPADSAGIEVGDVIVEFDGRPVYDADVLRKMIRRTGPGKQVTIRVMRGTDGKTLTARLAEAPERDVITRMFRSVRPAIPAVPTVPRVPRVPGAAPRVQTRVSGAGGAGTGLLGMSVRALTPQLGAYFGAPEGRGVLVENVGKESRAAKAGFLAGDVIVRAGKKNVRSAADIRTVLAAHDSGETIPMEIVRKGSKKTLTVLAPGQRVEKNIRIRMNGDGEEDIDINVDGDDMGGYEIELEGLGEALEGLDERLQEMDIRLDGSGGLLERLRSEGPALLQDAQRLNEARQLDAARRQAESARRLRITTISNSGDPIAP